MNITGRANDALQAHPRECSELKKSLIEERIMQLSCAIEAMATRLDRFESKLRPALLPSVPVDVENNQKQPNMQSSIIASELESMISRLNTMISFADEIVDRCQL